MNKYMAGLFALITLSMAFVYFRMKKVAIIFWVLAILLSVAMMWYHATDTLKINW